MGKTLEFFYDFSCPYAYLASTRVPQIAAATGAELIYKPFLLGGVFRALGSETPDVLPMSAPKARLNGLDIQRWAELFDVPLRMPRSHPNRTVWALRAALASGELARATQALFKAYWVDGDDISDEGVLSAALTSAGLDAEQAKSGAAEQSVKDDLRSRTDEAIARGVFGAPACFVAGEMFWGQDRLGSVAEALGGSPDLVGLCPDPVGLDRPSEVEFFFDFSSPFAYLASTQIEAIAATAGARVAFRPFLLGALFKNIGTDDVPMLGFSQAKQAWIGNDIDRHAKRYGIGFRFPSSFPIRSVLPLRTAIAAGDKLPQVMHTLFKAAWVDDRDIAEAESVKQILDEAGLEPGFVDSASDPAVKAKLREYTDRAQTIGACGAPTCAVGEHLFWGQDRLELVRRALLGWTPKAG